MKLSLRAVGLRSLLSQPLSVTQIMELVPDTQVIIENTLRELKNRELITENDGYYQSIRATEYLPKAQNSHYSNVSDQEWIRMHSLPRTPVYAIISWYFEKIGKEFESAEDIRNEAFKEFDIACQLHKLYTLHDLYDIWESYTKTLDKDENDKPSLSGLFEYTSKLPRRIELNIAR